MESRLRDLPEKIYTLEELEKLKKYWVEKLHLQEWRITLRLKPAHEFGNNDGQTMISDSRAGAIITLRTPDSITDVDDGLPYNMEQVLVHELLHVYTRDSEPEDNELKAWRSYHRRLDNLATLLVELKTQEEAS